MSGLVPVLPLKAQPAIAGPGAVTHAEPIGNDIRMPSRAALQQQLDVGLFAGAARGRTSPPATVATASEAVTLSPAARALSVILDLPASPTSKILGAQALWPLRQPPMAPLLAATLAHTVDNSGLFYESHLQQFAAGTRTLAQLMQEPQAGLPIALAAGAAVAAAAVGSEVALPEGMPKNSLESALEAALGNSLESSPAETPESEAASLQDPDGQERSLKTLGASAVDAARSSALVPAGVHADAVALVRQQLELLAQPVFRWGGEAWPGTPMDWEIQQEPDDRAAGEAPQRSWSTRLALRLPELKDVEVRLSLVGNTLQLQLSASENGTVALLGNERHELPARFAALGLQLKGVWVGALAPEPAVPAGTKDEATHNG
ncbi:flagellar hook-length control protein FliK [Polaromonas sp.]|uniref:flagellar hook-length control protein FliK n=1 Tax=Polaromonas sp. TaxID=1869339 RepID=UPI0017B9D58D|nr:flagellar hook-length control protein FliK [Polaromonas sp.]NMM05794.1 flagellar hook-length control protein FliK [Polaromonas sp.]